MKSQWLVGDPPAVGDRPRVFCLPHAGGGIAGFVPWRRAATHVDIQPVRLPGREGRISELPLRRMDEVVRRLLTGLRPYASRPFALFGHSMGALIAFELAYAMEQDGLPIAAVFVSGRTSPSLPEVRTNLHELPSDKLIEILNEISATPKSVLEDPEIMAVVLPVIRADFSVVASYAYEPGRTIASPLIAYYGEADGWGDRLRVAKWEGLTRGPFRCRGFDGDHFFPYQAGLVGDLVGDLERELLYHAGTGEVQPRGM